MGIAPPTPAKRAPSPAAAVKRAAASLAAADRAADAPRKQPRPSPPLPAPSSLLLPAFSLILWGAFSSAIIMLNKRVYAGGFPYPCALTSVGSGFSALAAALAARLASALSRGGGGGGGGVPDFLRLRSARELFYPQQQQQQQQQQQPEQDQGRRRSQRQQEIAAAASAAANGNNDNNNNSNNNSSGNNKNKSKIETETPHCSSTVVPHHVSIPSCPSTNPYLQQPPSDPPPGSHFADTCCYGVRAVSAHTNASA
jgi:hypothetical protein